MLTHIETDIGPATTAGDVLVDRLTRQQMRTYRLRPGDQGTRPPVATLLAVTPNPVRFGSAGSIPYELRAEGQVRITLLDVRGTVVATLVDGVRSAGPHVEQWDGRDSHGAVVTPGVYLLRLEAAGRVSTGKLVFLR